MKPIRHPPTVTEGLFVDTIGKSFGDLMPALPAGVQIVALRRGGRNEPASPNLVIAENDVVLATAATKCLSS